MKLKTVASAEFDQRLAQITQDAYISFINGISLLLQPEISAHGASLLATLDSLPVVKVVKRGKEEASGAGFTRKIGVGCEIEFYSTKVPGNMIQMRCKLDLQMLFAGMIGPYSFSNEMRTVAVSVDSMRNKSLGTKLGQELATTFLSQNSGRLTKLSLELAAKRDGLSTCVTSINKFLGRKPKRTRAV